MPLTVLERGLWLAAHQPLSAAFVDNSVLYVAIDPVEQVIEDNPTLALDVFSNTVDRWSDPEAGPRPHAFGWLSYDAVRHDEPDAERDTRPRGDLAPRAYLARFAAVLSVDLSSGAVEVHARDRTTAARLETAWAHTLQADWRSAPAVRLHTTSATSAEAHHRAVHTVQQAIRAGEVYLVNIARMIHAPTQLAPLEMARRVAASRAPFAALIDAGTARIGGMSMELALSWHRRSGTLRSRPIKGTRPRAPDRPTDTLLARQLALDPKERAENIMAVDVHRNDLGRVAAPGSVQVPALCVVESHAFVHHLVSTVQATVRPGASTREVLSSVLPVGSVTGAPKRSAMRIIARIEPERRGVYTGVYGMVGRDGSLTLAVAIRTMVCDRAGLHYGSGGGIVIDSDPAREWEELAWKERALAGTDAR